MKFSLFKIVCSTACDDKLKPDDGDLENLAKRAKLSAESSAIAIDKALSFIAASNQRIASMEKQSARSARRIHMTMRA